MAHGHYLAAQPAVVKTGAGRFAHRVAELSEGRLTIKVFAGGELVPPLNTFEAVSDGTVETGSGAACSWAGKTRDSGLLLFRLGSMLRASMRGFIAAAVRRCGKKYKLKM